MSTITQPMITESDLINPLPTTTAASGTAPTFVQATPVRTTGDVIDTTSSSAEEQCNEELPDYETLRQQNLQKINKYYNETLGKYKDNYSSYLNKVNSADEDDRQNANTQLKPRVKTYNDHLIKINKEMIAKVNLTNDLMIKQKEELELKRKRIQSNYKNIDNFKQKNRQFKNDNQGKEVNLSESNQLINSNHTYKYGYIGANILALVVIISLLMYLYMY
jgi:hypothetical protein